MVYMIFTRWDTICDGSLKFADRNKPDSVIAYYPFPKYKANNEGGYDGFQVLSTGAVSNMMLNWNEPALFFQANYPLNTIVKFNIKTEEFTRYLVTELPLVYDTLVGATNTVYTVYKNTMGDYMSNPFRSCWMIRIKQTDNINDTSVYNNVLLTYTAEEGFKSIEMKPKDKAKYYSNRSMVRDFGAVNSNTIWFSYLNHNYMNTTEFKHIFNSEVITYNIETGEYQSICIPPELVEQEDDFTATISSVRVLAHPDGYAVIGILLSSGHFLFYNPTNSIEEVENNPRFQRIGIRRIYPNPVQQHTTTAEIMCYVDDLSKLDIGIYNLLGEKIIDLNNNYEYNQANNTIYTTFEVPADVTNGIYYFNVRSGSEYRTQAIMIGK